MIVPSGAEAVHEGSKLIQLIQLSVTFFEQVFGNRLSYGAGLGFIQHPKIRRNVQFIGKFTDQFGAKCMNR